MKKQIGSGLVAALSVLGILIAIFTFVVGMYIKYHNMGVAFEKRLEGTWQENKVVELKIRGTQKSLKKNSH